MARLAADGTARVGGSPAQLADDANSEMGIDDVQSLTCTADMTAAQ